MLEIFQQYLSGKTSFTAVELKIVEAASVPEKLGKNELLLQAGDVCYYNCFILQGCMRLYRFTPDGREHTIRLAKENWWITDWNSWNSGKPSKFNIDCLEDCEVILFTKPNWEELKDKIPAFCAFEDALLERSLKAKDERIDAANNAAPKERYTILQQSFPTVFERVPVVMIASYLGVTMETLERIQARLLD